MSYSKTKESRIMKRLSLLFLSLALSLVWFVSQPKEGTGGEPQNGIPTSSPLTKIRFVSTGLDAKDMHIVLGVEKGVFKKNGIDFQFIPFEKGGPEALAAAASGQAEMGGFGTPILIGISRGLQIKVVGAPVQKEILFVLVGRPDIKTVRDLKGQTIATGALGGGSHQSALKILAANGLNDSDVKVAATGGTNPELILKSGKVAAVVVSEPIVTKFELAGIGRTLARAADVYGKYQHSYIFATNSLIKNNPEAIRGVLKAQKEAAEYAASHQEELIALTIKTLGLDEALVRSYFKKTIPSWDKSGSVDVEGANGAFRILKDLDEIDKNYNPKVDQWFDSRFLPK
jgi:NitT/TauT family transport system substrate-binding protein